MNISHTSLHTALWITWEKQVRNKTLSARLNAELLEICEPGGRLKRYLRSTRKTFIALWRWRGKTVIAQNPSVVLSLLVVLTKFFFRYRAIIDAHNAGVLPENSNYALRRLLDFIIRHADVVIVTNHGLADVVSKLHGNPLILPDPLPRFAHHNTSPDLNHSPKILFICSWALDEPYLEVLRAAEALSTSDFFVTGASKGRETKLGKSIPSNVTLTGFVPDVEYHALLANCDIVIDLTTRENCLVCGAYEAVAMEKPFVLSDTEALKSYFHQGGVHVANNCESIVWGIQQIIREYDSYLEKVIELKAELESSWATRLQEIEPNLFGKVVDGRC